MDSKMAILHKLIWMTLLFVMAQGLPQPENSTGLDSNDLPKVTKKTDYRLRTDILPSHYIMKFVPNLNVDMFMYEGKSSIDINVLVENEKITLHAVNLTFDEEYTSLIDSNNRTIKPVVHIIDNVTQFLTLGFETPITAGSYRLNLKYIGQLNDYGFGFHRRFYVNEEGEKVWLAVTNMEPTWARHAFPCFDEPAMKATFQISIKHHNNYTAISNMPTISQTKDDADSDKIWTNFDVTPMMSTYLVAFVVADFKNISSNDGYFRFWAPKNKIHKCRYALDIAPKILKALEDYTESRHVIPKMDNIAVLSHSSQAMENWGAVIYTEEAILYDEGITKTSKKELITATVAHEFSHQWFGNLVTPAWWDQVWLSEGISNYFQYFITDKVEPKWRMMDKMVVGALQEIAFRLNNPRPLNTKVNKPSGIIMDAVPYYIGGSILRMTSHVMTENAFHTGIRQYLKKNEYGAATFDDLFNALVATAENVPKNMSLKEYLNSWNNQTGYPVINVNSSSTVPGHVSINQTPYIYKRRNMCRKYKNETQIRCMESWWIPLNFATQSDPNFNDTQPSHWLKPNQFAQEVPLELNDDQWIIVNKQQTGFYRVNYDKHNWGLIADYLNTPNYTNIHVLNRAQLLDDSFNFVLDNYIDDWSVFLNISRYLAQEDDYFAWYPAFRAFETLNVRLRNTESYKLFKLYILKLITKMENRVGYRETSEDDHLTKLRRIAVVKWACEMGSMKCAEETLKSLIEHLNGSKKISPDLQNIVFCAGIRTANVTVWNKMFDLYLETKNEDDSEAILNALSCSLDSRIIKSFLAKVVDPDYKTRMDQKNGDPTDIIYSVIEHNPAGVDLLLDYITENLAASNETVPFRYSIYLRPVAMVITTHAQIEKLKSVFDGISMDPNHRIQKVRCNFLSQAKYILTRVERNKPQIWSFLVSQNLSDDSMVESHAEPTASATDAMCP